MHTRNLDTEKKIPQLESSWLQHLAGEFEKESMKKLKVFLEQEYQSGKMIYPRADDYFRAFEGTSFSKCKVVILGQDPYHGPGQAHGLCFSVQKGTAKPPSLGNIFKELRSDLGLSLSQHGDLSLWAQQGVLLLNSVLTVEEGKPGSHQKKGWEDFTDAVIKTLNDQREKLVFILWGAYAQKKAAFVDRQRHLVLECVHPSPLSAHRGFFGSKPFSKTNEYLRKTGQSPIDWSLD
jgi:uracil-DNA glycosylase